MITKKQTIKEFIKTKKAQFIALQETHTDNSRISKTLGVTDAIRSHANTASKGVGLLWTDESVKCMKVWKDDEGRVVIGVFKIDNEKVIIGSVYAPNIDASVRSQQKYSRFILDLEALLGEAKRHAQSFILCDDFNLYCDPYLDTEESNIMPHPYPICKDNFLDFLTNTNAADLLRTTHRRKKTLLLFPLGRE